jgi:hypothetical protein
MWPERGLIWRAGLICALMKSISPSAVILGPMIGIFLEALFLEIGIRIFGKNLAGILTGGALAVFSALLHKIFSLLILYGFKILYIYLHLFQFVALQVNIEDADPWVVIFILIGVYLLSGVLAASLGYRIGKKSIGTQISEEKIHWNGVKRNNLFTINETQNFSIWFLVIHIISIPLGLFLMSWIDFYYALGFIVLYLTFCFFCYFHNLKRLKKPFFWIQLLIIVILAAFFWDFSGGFEKEKILEGLIIGLKMCIRALLVVVGFTAISVELRNPVIKDFLFKKGFEQIYLSLSMAFSALPIMIQTMVKPKYFFSNPFKSVSLAIVHANRWFEVFENSPNKS